MRRVDASVLMMLSLIFGGCDQAGPDVSVATLADSSGVEIIASPDANVASLQIDKLPDLTLGGLDATGPEAFGDVAGVVVARDGSIWVSDEQSLSVEVFEADGTHRMSVGRGGDGPGEFRRVVLVGAAGDSVAVHDGPSYQLNWFGLDGEWLGSERVEASLRAVTTAGDPVGATSPLFTVPPGSVMRDSATFELWSSSAEAWVEIARVPTQPFLVSEGGSLTPIPFRATAAVDANEYMLVVAGPVFEVRQLDRGGILQRILRVSRPPRPVDANARAERRAFVEAEYDADRRDRYLAALEHEHVPDLQAAYHDVVAGSDGSSWAHRYDVSFPDAQPWDVFGADGSYEGAVQLPDGFELAAVTAEHVYGVHTDECGVDEVRRYRIIRP